MLAACSTPYGKPGLLGGIDAVPVTNDTYRISALGNGYTSAGTITDYVLLKSAELALGKGVTSFTILGGKDTTYQSAVQTPGTLSMSTIGSTSFATYNPGFSYNIVDPGQDVMVRVWSPGPKDMLPPNTFPAQQVFDNINPRVKRSK
jgi:hypothetical protein